MRAKMHVANIIGRIGRDLAAARQERGWTQAQLAESTGVSIDTLTQLEEGQSVAFEDLVAIALALDLEEKLLAFSNPRNVPARSS